DLDFNLKEIVLKIGALNIRPSCIPTPENFPSYKARHSNTPFKQEDWLILALKEKELYGERDSKKSRSSSLVLTVGEKPTAGDKFFSQYLFNANQYFGDNIDNAPWARPICMLDIDDTLERSDIVYVSPCVIRELGLTIDPNLHKGFQAYNNQGEVIVKLISWKEDYYGRVNDGTEVPRLEGVAVMLRKDYYDRILGLYDKESWF